MVKPEEKPVIKSEEMEWEFEEKPVIKSEEMEWEDEVELKQLIRHAGVCKRDSEQGSLGSHMLEGGLGGVKSE